MSSARTVLSRRCRLQIEELETRQLPAGLAPTAVEQLLLEQLNDARANPAAYGASIGLDLSNVAPSAPLAWDTRLVEAARVHSVDMNTRNYFAHNTPEGITPGQQISAAGYAWTAQGQSLAAGSAFATPDQALSGLIIDAGVANLGHRRHLLAIDAAFRSHNQVGVGILQGGSGTYSNYYTINTATSGDPRPFVTGVVFQDRNGNARYDTGEGLGGVSVAVAGVGTVTTFESGGYSIRVPGAGSYSVTAAGPGLTSPVTQTAAVGAQNLRLNFTPRDNSYLPKLFQDTLGRAPSAAETAAYTQALQAYGPVVVASILERSGEARTRLVKGWYQQYLGRTVGDADVQGLVGYMLGGATETQALAYLFSTREYYDRASSLGTGTTADARYLDGLYRDLLGRSIDAGGLSFWQSALPSFGRLTVAQVMLGTTEYTERLVRGYYTSILRRANTPTAGEVNFWVNSRLDPTTIRIIFRATGEYMNG